MVVLDDWHYNRNLVHHHLGVLGNAAIADGITISNVKISLF